MASFHIHLAISNRFAEKNKITDTTAFFRGTMDPDITENKDVSHYTGSKNRSNLSEYLKQKVCLYEYLKQNDIDSDYQKAVFLHLITDYLFYNHFLDKEYIRKTPYQNYIRDLYFSYNEVSAYLINKYNLDFKEYNKKISENIDFYRKKRNANNFKQCINIIPYDKLDIFIEEVASIDIDKYKNKIMKNQDNVLP